MKLISALIFGLSLLIIITSCNDKPTIVGYDYLSDTLSIYPVSSRGLPLIISSNVFKKRLALFNTGAHLIGRYEASEGTYLAYSSIRFSNFPDTNAKVLKIDSAVLFMQPTNYAFGDTNANRLSFDIFKLQKVFTDSTDSLDRSFYGGDIVGKFSGKIIYADSIPEISVAIDTNMVREWLIEQADTTRDTLMNGIVIMPGNDCSLIRQFSASSYADSKSPQPYIKVFYKRSDGKDTSRVIKSAIDATWAHSPFPKEGEITSQGAVTYRTELFFDVSILPELASVHKADLELTLDMQNTRYGNLGLDSTLNADYIYDSTNATTGTRSYFGYKVSGTDKFYFPSISSAVETWNRRGNKGSIIISNEGLANGLQRMNRLAFYGLNVQDTTKLPKLRIIYTQRPKRNCN